MHYRSLAYVITQLEAPLRLPTSIAYVNTWRVLQPPHLIESFSYNSPRFYFCHIANQSIRLKRRNLEKGLVASKNPHPVDQSEEPAKESLIKKLSTKTTVTWNNHWKYKYTENPYRLKLYKKIIKRGGINYKSTDVSHRLTGTARLLSLRTTTIWTKDILRIKKTQNLPFFL